MEEKKKQSLLRYIAIMFVVAFVLVLVSLVGQTRSIGQLSESSASALQRAEELQTTNRQLSEERDALEAERNSLQAACDDLLQEKAQLEEALSQAQEAAEETRQTVMNVYENLLEGDANDVLPEYLGPKGLETYENLTKEGNAQ